MESNIKVTILGNSAAIPTKENHLSAQVIIVNGEYFLMDCGEGTQIQLIKHGLKYSRINNIFISHLHGDHFFGLIGLLSTYHLLGREKEMNIYSPPHLEEIIRMQLDIAHTSLSYNLVFHSIETEKKEMVFENEKARVFALPLEHRVKTYGYIFSQTPAHKLKINKSFIEEYKPDIEQIIKIKEGDDFITNDGIRLENSQITIPPKALLSYAYCSDTRYFKDLAIYLANVSVLYHEATFDNSFKDLAHEKFHSTAENAAQTALEAGVGQLILGHFSARNSDKNILLEEASTIFPYTIISEEGIEYEIKN